MSWRTGALNPVALEAEQLPERATPKRLVEESAQLFPDPFRDRTAHGLRRVGSVLPGLERVGQQVVGAGHLDRVGAGQLADEERIVVPEPGGERPAEQR